MPSGIPKIRRPFVLKGKAVPIPDSIYDNLPEEYAARKAELMRRYYRLYQVTNRPRYRQNLRNWRAKQTIESKQAVVKPIEWVYCPREKV